MPSKRRWRITGLAAGIDLRSHDNQHMLLSVGTSGALFASLIGVMAITGEFRHGTIRPTFVVTPHRSRVITAKVIASLLTGLLFGLLAIALSLGVGYAVLAGKGIDFALDTKHVLLLVLGTLGMTALWAALGVGLGAVIKNQVFAIIGLIIWAMLVDNLLRGLVPDVGRFTPTAASASITADPADYLLGPLAGGLLLVSYTVVIVAAGTLLVARRDVT
jgi:ABC-2 type transport system permease protein